MDDVSLPLADRAPFSAPELPLARYALTLRAVEPVALPPLSGALWRGVFGNALRRMADGRDPLPRGTDAEAARGLYRAFFETPPPTGASKMRLYKAAPHPYVIAAAVTAEPACLRAGEDARLMLTLIGRANDHLPAVITAFRRAAEAGIGKSRGRMTLDAVDAIWGSEAPAERSIYRPGQGVAQVPAVSPRVPAAPRFIEVTLVSPMRLVRDNRPVRADTFTAADLFSALVRRVSMLSYFHADQTHETDFRALKAMAQSARVVERDLGWQDQIRWSAAHRAEIDMGGLVGWFVLDMTRLAQLWPYLWLAQWTHVGKGTTSGLGAVALKPA